MGSNDKTMMTKPNQMVQVAETERYKKEENNQAYLLTWTKSCQHHTQTQNANKQQTVCVCVCVCVCLFVCVCMQGSRSLTRAGRFSGHMWQTEATALPTKWIY